MSQAGDLYGQSLYDLAVEENLTDEILGEMSVVKEAQEEVAGIKARAAADIEQEKKKAINEAKDEIGGLAMDIAGKVVEKEIKESDHKKLIDDFITKVGA